MRPIRTGSVGALAVAGIVVLGGCGSGENGAAGEAEFQPTAIRVVLDRDGPGGTAAERRSLRCVAGSRSRACDAVRSLAGDAGAVTPPDTPCTEIFGGPDSALIRGTLRGTAVDLELTRANGCEIDRFDAFAKLLKALFPGYRPGAAITAGVQGA